MFLASSACFCAFLAVIVVMFCAFFCTFGADVFTQLHGLHNMTRIPNQQIERSAAYICTIKISFYACPHRRNVLFIKAS